MEKLQLIVGIAVGVLAGAIVALKAIAPRTKTLADDKVLEKLEAQEARVEHLFPGSAAAKAALDAVSAATEKKPDAP